MTRLQGFRAGVCGSGIPAERIDSDEYRDGYRDGLVAASVYSKVCDEQRHKWSFQRMSGGCIGRDMSGGANGVFAVDDRDYGVLEACDADDTEGARSGEDVHRIDRPEVDLSGGVEL